MKYAMIICFLLSLPRTLGAEVPISEEEKLLGMIRKYMACVQRCEAEKDRVTPSSYEYIRKQCHKPFVNLLLELDKATQNK